MRKILLLSLCLLFAGSMFNQTSAVPAYPKPIKFTQADGTTVTFIMRGDEHSKWAQTTDGYTLLYNAKGEFEYAVVDNKGDAVPSGVRASDVARRKSNETALLQNTRKGITFSESQVSMIKQIKQMRAQQNAQQRAFPTTGARKLVCILMGYKDKAFTKTQADINNLFNQVGYSAGGATGSVKDYYNENSWNQFNLTVTVAGPFTASQNLSYYGANDASGNDVKPRELVTEAVNAADATVNFADFDNDGDGAVDGVYVLFAGYGEEAGASANCIWSHAWNITTLTKDGKTISKYSCSPELMGTSGTTLTGIGVICHEFGHVLGAPDYYDTNYSTGGQFDGTGDWDMMAAGSWNNNGLTPAHHNAYSKVKVYGWATATVLSSATNVTVNPVIGNQSFYQINSTTSGEYWLIENRQQTGFDAYLPGHGMMIYHVNSGVASAATSNNINASYPQKMYPVCASATSNPGSTAATYGTINGAGCPFPGTGAKTSFTDATTPNMKSWAGASTAKPITAIAENTTTKVITFAFMGGATTATAPLATSNAATGISTSGATLNGSVTANNATTTVTFEYGTTTSYGTSVNASPASVTGATATAVSATLTGLANNTTYYYRVKAVNSVGTTYGAQQSFTTSAVVAPSATTNAATSVASTSSTLNGSVNANGTSTTVTFEYGTTTSYGSTANATPATVTGSAATAVTAALTGLVANTTYYYRVKAVSAAGTTYGAQQSFTTTNVVVTYCTSKGNSVADEWIDLVQFAGINRTSGAEAGYKDNTSLVGTVTRGSSVSIYLSAGFKSTAYTEYFAVWIDFNQNGTFDTAEKVASGSSKLATTLTYTVAVPSTALLGNTRMRVSMKYNAAPTACEAFSYGEVEDYTVNVTAAAGAPGIENPFATQLGNEEPSSFTVFPNPASSQVKIQLNGIEGDVMMRIYDMRGGLVKVMPINGETDVDVSDLAKGVYVISIDEEKEAIKKQFVKL